MNPINPIIGTPAHFNAASAALVAHGPKVDSGTFAAEVARAGLCRPTPRPIYYVVTTATTLSQGNAVTFFRSGIGDDQSYHGLSSGTPATEALTNLNVGGKLPQGEHFLCQGIEFIFADTTTLADLRKLKDCVVEWTDPSKPNTPIKLGQLEDFAQRGGITYIPTESSAVSSVNVTTSLPRFNGALYTFGGDTIFDLRGDNAAVGQLAIRNYGSAISLGAAVNVKCKLHGVYAQRVN